MNSIRGAKPLHRNFDFMNKSSRSNTVPPSPTHCKNETKLYYFIIGYRGRPRERGNYYHGQCNRNIGIEIYVSKNMCLLSLLWMYCMFQYSFQSVSCFTNKMCYHSEFARFGIIQYQIYLILFIKSQFPCGGFAPSQNS